MPFDLTAAMLITYLWPVLLCAAAWAIAIWALNAPDQMSMVVRRLISCNAPRTAEAAATLGAIRRGEQEAPKA